MAKPGRYRRIATIVSAVLLSLCVAATVLGVIADPSRHRIALGDEFFLGVHRFRGIQIRFVAFSDPVGPYRGSIINGVANPSRHGFGDTAGIYWRYFRWPTTVGQPRTVLWTLSVNCLYFLIPLSILPSLWMCQHLRRARLRKSGCCQRCGYPPTPGEQRGTCPECGEAAAEFSVPGTPAPPAGTARSR